MQQRRPLHSRRYDHIMTAQKLSTQYTEQGGIYTCTRPRSHLVVVRYKGDARKRQIQANEQVGAAMHLQSQAQLDKDPPATAKVCLLQNARKFSEWSAPRERTQQQHFHAACSRQQEHGKS